MMLTFALFPHLDDFEDPYHLSGKTVFVLRLKRFPERGKKLLIKDLKLYELPSTY